MFCTQCGAQAAPGHKFCAGCGTRLDGAAADTALSAPPPVIPPNPLAEDWRETTNYRVVLGHPEVKALISDASKASKAGMTAEEFLKMASPLLSAAGASPAATRLIADFAPSFYAKMGVKTGKDAKNGYATSYGRVIAAILCSLASRNQTLVAVHDGTDGCILQADIPSSLTTGKGKLSVTVERKPEGTLATSAAVFEGQASDWGRAKRVLDELHQDILDYRTLQP